QSVPSTQPAPPTTKLSAPDPVSASPIEQTMPVRTVGTPVPASPPRIVARAAEDSAGVLASAQLDAVKAALQGSKLLSMFLDNAIRCEIEAGGFRLFFATENRTMTEMLPRDAMERLRTVLNQVIGQPLRV